MDPRAADGRRDRGRQVPVADQFDARSGGPDVVNQAPVPVPVENDHGQGADGAVEGGRDRLQVVLHRSVQVDLPASGRTDDDLVHVDVGGVEQAAALGGGEHRHRVRSPGGAEIRPLQRVDREVDLQIARGTPADFLADVEHGRLVPLPLADHHPAVDRHVRQDPAHRLDGDVVRVVAVSVSHRLGRRHRGGLGNGNEVVVPELAGHEPAPAAAAASAGRSAASRAWLRLIGGLKEGMPVIAAPITRPWMSCVPS